MKASHLLALIIVAFVLFSPTVSQAEKSWIYPTFSLIEEYDDNIYLTRNDRKGDFITTVVPGIAIEPRLNEHKMKLNYKSEFLFFSDYYEENIINQSVQMASTFNFPDWKLEINDMYRYFEDRSGAEDTSRIPRTSNHGDAKVTLLFNKVDVGFKYVNDYDGYRSEEPIGSFRGLPLTYHDLTNNDQSGEIEFAVKFWPKTSMLFAGRYGELHYDKENKSSNYYYDSMVGLRGQLTSKGIIEGKVGYRKENYDDYADDYGDVIFLTNFLESFDDRNTLQISAERTTNPSNYTDNAYYASSFYFSEFVHGFTDRFKGKVNTSIQFNDYPTETAEDGEFGHREDIIWICGAGLSYELVRWGTVNFDYTYSERDSNFDPYDYHDNRLRLGLMVDF